MGTATKRQRQALARAHANNKRMKEDVRPRRSMATTVYTNAGLPPVSEAPPDARVIEARGPYAVAMACRGRFLGLFLKGK